MIRREFDIGEGDAYNRALIDRAERRLKNLNYFKTVKITNEPGSAPDRVVVNVNVEEMSTGEFSISGGYSTADGFLAEVSVADRNLMGRGQFAKASVSYGQYTRGFDLSFVEPYLLGYRMAGGIDLFARQTLATSYVSYNTQTIGTNLRLGFALSEELSLQPHYSIYRQEITLPDQYNNCISTHDADCSTGATPTLATRSTHATRCRGDRHRRMLSPTAKPRSPVRMELANGAVVTSLVGYTLAYNTLDNNKSPTSGLYASIHAGLRGRRRRREFHPIDRGNAHLLRSAARTSSACSTCKAAMLTGWGGKDLRMLDHFQMGPNLVRGFAPAGIGPRDLTPGTTNDALGGTMYWGASVEAQTPLYFLPKEIGIKVAAFVDAGSLWNYKGPTAWNVTGETLQVADTMAIRSSVGMGFIWDSHSGRCGSILPTP